MRTNELKTEGGPVLCFLSTVFSTLQVFHFSQGKCGNLMNGIRSSLQSSSFSEAFQVLEVQEDEAFP